MKKLTFSLMALLAFSFSLKAQQFVSTTPANRNVILEEFTGRLCGYCPDGHVIANQIKANYPDRFWSVNIHSAGQNNYSLDTYPNLNTTKGNQIRAAFGANSFPSGVVNRSTSSAVGRGSWSGYATQQMGQAAECNIGGRVTLNPVSRVATITVEVYYTGNSSVDENYLTVVMLQDSIWGSQSSGSTNPAQWQNGQYCHMHILRDVITNVMGDPISPTTQGTLVTKTYTYTIPETIGSPNGVAVNLNHISFVAWVSERYQGTPTRPILNANKLSIVEGYDEPIYPMIKKTDLTLSCSTSKELLVDVQNAGTDVLTSMSLSVELNGATYAAQWSGSLASSETETISVPIEVQIGEYQAVVSITEANGETVSQSKTVTVKGMDWIKHGVSGSEERLKLILMQDKYGEQITWEFVASNGEVLASGGPYATLVGSSATQPHIEYVVVPANDCIRFSIYDSGENGICCNNGNGYFTISDSNNNVIVGDQNDGNFGSEATYLISTREETATVAVGETEVTMASETEAHFVSSLQSYMYPEQVGFMYGKLTSSQMNTVVGVLNEFQKILASVDELEPNMMYRVKAFAVVDGETYYGQEYHFFTSYTGLSELENSLKLYPNPTSGVLNIEGAGMTSVEVYNAIGQRVMMKEVDGDSAQLDTESLGNGVYFIRIHANDGSILNRTFSVAR